VTLLKIAHIGHPVVGDRKFGRRGPASAGARRTLLHAERLGLRHPATGRDLDVRAPQPEDLRAYIASLSEGGARP